MSSPSRCGSPRCRDRGTTCERTRRWGQTWRSSWIGSGTPLPRGPPARSTLTSRRGARKLRLHAYGCRNRNADPRWLRRARSAADRAGSGPIAGRPATLLLGASVPYVRPTASLVTRRCSWSALRPQVSATLATPAFQSFLNHVGERRDERPAFQRGRLETGGQPAHELFLDSRRQVREHRAQSSSELGVRGEGALEPVALGIAQVRHELLKVGRHYALWRVASWAGAAERRRVRAARALMRSLDQLPFMTR